jgi:hypothetical protein
MRKLMLAFLATLAVPALLLAGSSYVPSARGQQSASTVQVTTVVTVLGPNFLPPPEITKQDVNVYSGKERQDVLSWEHAAGQHAGLQLAILIDDDDSPTALGQHFNEIKKFINAQPNTTQVALFYAMSGSAKAAADFSADHAGVAQKLRLPLGRMAGTSPSIYLSLEDLIKHWPRNNMRHEVLMIASGIDRLHPELESPYVDDAVEAVLKSSVLVHTIYTGGFRLAESPFLQNVAWQNLIRVSGDSGGEQFFQGFQTPVDFTPIFAQLDAVLNHQYLLTFATPRSRKKNGELRRIDIVVEQHNVKVSHAAQVFVPGS